MRLSAVIRKEGRLFVSWCPELDVASQGRTRKQALSNLVEAVQLYLEDEDAKTPPGKAYLTTFEIEDGKTSRPASAWGFGRAAARRVRESRSTLQSRQAQGDRAWRDAGCRRSEPSGDRAWNPPIDHPSIGPHAKRVRAVAPIDRRPIHVVRGDDLHTGINTSLNVGVMMAAGASTRPGEVVL